MVSKAICWRGLIFEASCAYSKISPLPDLLLKKGGLFFGTIRYCVFFEKELMQSSISELELSLITASHNARKGQDDNASMA